MCAATSQQFCVRWNSHLGSLGSAFPEFLSGQNFVDVTLACEGHQLHCHRIILASCSSYFSSLLRENPCKHPIIILPRDIKLWEIQALVDFMYRGHVNVSQTGLPDLLKSAEILQIRGLSGSEAVFNLNQSSINNNSSGVQSSGMHSTAPSSLSSSPSFNGPNDTNLNPNEQTASINTMSPGSNSLLLNEIATSSPAPHQNTSITNGGTNSSNSSSSKDRRISISETQIQEANNSVVSGASATTSCNNIITPKEEPLDDNADESIINASTDSPPEQEDDSYIGKYSDFLDQSDKQEILPLQQNHNQTEQQQEQEQNNSNQQKKLQSIHQLQQFKKILTNNKSETNEIQLNLEKKRKSSTDAAINKINNNNTNNRNNTIIKRLDNKRLSISSSSNLNLLLTNNDDEINDGNASDSSDTSSIFIVEPEIPLIEINDILDENFEYNLINKSNNDIGNQLNTFGSKVAKLTKENVTAILNKRNSKASNVNNNDKSCVKSIRISGYSQQSSQKILENEYRKVKESNGRQMKSQAQKNSSNNQQNSSVLPPFLKFNSESMSIYVKPSSDHQERMNSLHNSSSVTIVPSTSKSTINLKRSNVQRKQIPKNDYFETIKMEYEVNSENNNDFENVECIPNVQISYNNMEDEQNEFSIVESFAPINYDDIQIDENYYSNPGNYEYSETSNNVFRNLLSERMETKLENKSSNNNNNGKKKQKTSLSSSPSSVNQNFINGSTPSPSAVILRSPRCNQPRSYSTDALYAALMDVKAGKSIYRASQVHNVPRKTLRNWMKRWHIKSAHPMPRQLKQAAERKKLKQLLNNGNQ